MVEISYNGKIITCKPNEEMNVAKFSDFVRRKFEAMFSKQIQNEDVYSVTEETPVKSRSLPVTARFILIDTTQNAIPSPYSTLKQQGEENHSGGFPKRNSATINSTELKFLDN